MFYIKDESVHPAEVLSEEVVDYHNVTYTYYTIRVGGKAILNVNSSDLYKTREEVTNTLRALRKEVKGFRNCCRRFKD